MDKCPEQCLLVGRWKMFVGIKGSFLYIHSVAMIGTVFAGERQPRKISVPSCFCVQSMLWDLH